MARRRRRQARRGRVLRRTGDRRCGSRDDGLRRAAQGGPATAGGWHELEIRRRLVALDLGAGRLREARARRAPGRLLRACSWRPMAAVLPAPALRCSPASGPSRPRSGGARTPRPARTASASGSRRRTRASRASGCSRSSRPQPGERMLEVGPGTGYYSLDVAARLDGGTLAVFDIQQEMLDHVMRAAQRARASRTSSRRSATRSTLPYEDDSFDARLPRHRAGRDPGPGAALARAGARVLKPGGRLVVGELFGDPHMVTLGKLRERAARAGLRVRAPARHAARVTSRASGKLTSAPARAALDRERAAAASHPPALARSERSRMATAYARRRRVRRGLDRAGAAAAPRSIATAPALACGRPRSSLSRWAPTSSSSSPCAARRPRLRGLPPLGRAPATLLVSLRPRRDLVRRREGCRGALRPAARAPAAGGGRRDGADAPVSRASLPVRRAGRRRSRHGARAASPGPTAR